MGFDSACIFINKYIYDETKVMQLFIIVLIFFYLKENRKISTKQTEQNTNKLIKKNISTKAS